jgi:hypothetical protein
MLRPWDNRRRFGFFIKLCNRSIPFLNLFVYYIPKPPEDAGFFGKVFFARKHRRERVIASPIASEGWCFLGKKTKPKPASSGGLGIHPNNLKTLVLAKFDLTLPNLKK